MSFITLLLIAFVILLFILILLIFINKKINGKNRDSASNKEEKKNILDIRFANLPSALDSLSNDSIREEAKEIYNVYKILNYKNDDEEYQRNSWHTWQVSFLMAMYKRDLELFIPDSKEVFHKDIFSENLESLRASMKKFLKKYNSEVNVNNTKDILSKHLIWNAQEVATMMFFLYKYKNSNINKDKS